MTSSKGPASVTRSAFYIFDYPPEDELRVREHIRFLLDHIPKQKPGLRVEHINLFDFVLDYLKSRNLLDKVITMQREKERRGRSSRPCQGRWTRIRSPPTSLRLPNRGSTIW